MDIRELDPADTALLRRSWEIGHAAGDARRPYDFYPAWESFRLGAAGREDLEVRMLGAFADGVLWGVARLEMRLVDNLHAAACFYDVHPDRQRQGIGRALAEASYDLARRRGRRLLVTETYAPVADTSPGLLFAEAMGFTTAIVDDMLVVDLPATEHLWDGLAPANGDYAVRTWRDAVPDELIPGYCRLNELFFTEAPMGELEVEPERWDADRVRTRERHNARTGRHDAYAGAVASDGALVAVTDVAVSEHSPHRGFQSGTLVAPEHRGHRLGLAIKLANHRQVREHYPDCRLLLTGNADVNAAMNAINEVLGYRKVERCIELQRAI